MGAEKKKSTRVGIEVWWWPGWWKGERGRREELHYVALQFVTCDKEEIPWRKRGKKNKRENRTQKIKNKSAFRNTIPQCELCWFSSLNPFSSIDQSLLLTRKSKFFDCSAYNKWVFIILPYLFFCVWMQLKRFKITIVDVTEMTPFAPSQISPFTLPRSHFFVVFFLLFCFVPKSIIK